MATVDPLFAQWLQDDASYVYRADGDAATRWGATGLTTERVTGIATAAAAEAEGDRQLAFFSRGPIAIDVHQLVGTDWQAFVGLVINIAIDQLAYDAGIDVLVIGADTDETTGLSRVTVLRPLRGLS
jgi:hypothetical protein